MGLAPLLHTNALTTTLSRPPRTTHHAARPPVQPACTTRNSQPNASVCARLRVCARARADPGAAHDEIARPLALHTLPAHTLHHHPAPPRALRDIRICAV